MDIKEVILNNDIKNEKNVDIVKEEVNEKIEVISKDEKINNENLEVLNKDEINENEGIKDEITNNETINIIIEEQQYPNAIYFPTLSYHVLDILTKYMTIIQYYY